MPDIFFKKRNLNFATKIFIFILLIFFFTVLSSVLVLVIGLTNNDLRAVQLIQTIGLFAMPALFVSLTWGESPRVFLGINRMGNAKGITVVIVLMVVLIPFINLLSDLNHHIRLPEYMSGIARQMEKTEQDIDRLQQQLLGIRSFSMFLLNLLVVAVVPAISEELFFRGAFIGLLRTKTGFHTAIWVTAALFSILHFQFYGFFPRLLLGALLGYLYLWSNSLWVPVIAHFINNAVVVFFYYLVSNGLKLPDVDKAGTGDTWWLGLISLAITALLVWLAKRLLVVSRK